MCLACVTQAQISGALVLAMVDRFDSRLPKPGSRGAFVKMRHPHVSRGVVSCLDGNQSIKLSADVGHASRNHHTPGSGGVLTTFMDPNDPQTGLSGVGMSGDGRLRGA
jgi:hypothetical protein